MQQDFKPTFKYMVVVACGFSMVVPVVVNAASCLRFCSSLCCVRRLSIFRAEVAALTLITGLGPSAGPLGGSRST